MNLKLFLFLSFTLLTMSVSSEVFAKNNRPSSGRYLPSDHWLTCNGASDEAMRGTSWLHSQSPQAQAEADIPSFHGSYQFQVDDTWEELVTKSGNDCFHCGQTCTTTGTGQNQTQSCSCNFCTWQELETFYRPWSTQVTNWKVDWQPAPDYNQKRREWIAAGQPAISHNKSNIQQLLEFDPDRPNKYYLFPGETEEIRVSNDSGSEIRPSVAISKARYDYAISTNTNRAGYSDWRPERECDDVDLDIYATVQTGKRLITDPPNSIEFRKDFVDPQTQPDGKPDEPAGFHFIDISAMMYENQNVNDHYKDTQVQIRLRQHDRFLWFDRWVSGVVKLKDIQSVVAFHEDGSDLPPLAEYDLSSTQLLRTKHTGKEFHLIPGKTYELCTRMLRKNNIYYKSKGWFGSDNWSGWNCAMFQYSKEGADHRSGGRKFKDGFTRWFPIAPWLLFDW